MEIQCNQKSPKNNVTDTLLFLSLFATIASLAGNFASYLADKPKLQFLCSLGTIIAFPCLIATSIPDFKKGLQRPMKSNQL